MENQDKEIKKIDLFDFFYENEANLTAPLMERSWIVGPIELFTSHSLRSFNKLIKNGNIVQLTKDVESNIINRGGMALTTDLVMALEAIFGLEKVSYYSFITRVKESDGFIRRTVEFGIENTHKEFPIFGQFSFPCNDPSDLITDCVMFLTEYKLVEYSIGVFISLNGEFELNVFILERGKNCKPDTDRTKTLKISSYYANYYKPYEEHDWGPSVDKQDIKKRFLNGDLSMYNVNILVNKKITEKNIDESISFDIYLNKFQSDMNGNLNVVIDPYWFKEMQSYWQQFSS